MLSFFTWRGGRLFVGGGPEFFGIVKGGDQFFSVGLRGGPEFFEGQRGGGDQKFFPSWGPSIFVPWAQFLITIVINPNLFDTLHA